MQSIDMSSLDTSKLCTLAEALTISEEGENTFGGINLAID